VNLSFNVDTSQLDQLARFTSAVRGNLDKDLAKAMTLAAYDARDYLKNVTPRYVDQPTKWTLNSMFVEKAKPGDLSARFGFKDTAVKGTAAAKYLQPMVGGGRRSEKRSEAAMQAKGVLRAGEYIVPAEARPNGGVYPLKLDRYGNVPGPTMVRILSRIGGLREQGATQNVSGSRRSQRKRRESDFFVGTPGGLPRGIYARVGPRPRNGGMARGFHTIFHITRQPRYEPQFPVRDILAKKFSEKFPSIFERLVFASR
jgi:hypothetical protein